MKYFCYFQRNHVGMIRDFADADLLSSDYAAGSDENRCNVLQDGSEQERGMSRQRCRITPLITGQRLVWFTTTSLLVRRESPGCEGVKVSTTKAARAGRQSGDRRLGGQRDEGTDKTLLERFMSPTGRTS